MARFVTYGFAALLVSSIPGCQRREPPTRQLAAADQAVVTLVTARCEREARCARAGGASAKFTTREDCARQLARTMGPELDCPSGVDTVELFECVREIQDEDCDSALDTLERIAACDPFYLCAPKTTGLL